MYGLPRWKFIVYVVMIAVCAAAVVLCIMLKRTDAVVVAVLLTLWCIGIFLHALRKAKD